MLPLKQFEDFAAKTKLFSKNDRILLAVSGGKDSVLMLHLFKLLGLQIGVAHVNFNLRGDESKRDEDFVKNLTARLNVPLFTIQFNTKQYAAQHKISTQMAARDLRYQWFEELRIKENYDCIALGQHKNDVAETMLINLIRGTGLSGLHGILPKKNKLIRPLLFLNSTEIATLVRENNIAYVEDSSNLNNHYTRNKIRLDIIPQMREINPNLEDTFAENAARFSEIEHFLALNVEKIRKDLTHHSNNSVYFSIEKIKALEPITLLLYELLKPFNFSGSVATEIIAGLDGLSGKQFLSPTYSAIIDREFLIITSLQPSNATQQSIYKDTQTVQIGGDELWISYTDGNGFQKKTTIVYVDAEKLIYPLQVRNWQTGDRFIPFGMKTFKKLSDFFIDKKIPQHIKNTTPLLLNGNGEIIWVLGMRQDNRYMVGLSTKKVAIFEIK